MPQSAKTFSERLNRCLDDTGAPLSLRERAVILSKMLAIPKQEAWHYLEGHQVPNQTTLHKIAIEFEVESTWLAGEN